MKAHVANSISARLPQMTGNTVNLRFPSCLSQRVDRKKSLVIPWLSIKDPGLVYPNKLHSSPLQSMKNISTVAQGEDGIRVHFCYTIFSQKGTLHFLDLLFFTFEYLERNTVLNCCLSIIRHFHLEIERSCPGRDCESVIAIKIIRNLEFLGGCQLCISLLGMAMGQDKAGIQRSDPAHSLGLSICPVPLHTMDQLMPNLAQTCPIFICNRIK